MTAEQKRELLARIQISLNLSARDTESISSKAGEPEDLKKRLSGEFKKLGLFERLILKVAAFFWAVPNTSCWVTASWERPVRPSVSGCPIS